MESSCVLKFIHERIFLANGGAVLLEDLSILCCGRTGYATIPPIFHSSNSARRAEFDEHYKWATLKVSGGVRTMYILRYTMKATLVAQWNHRVFVNL